MSGKNYSKAVEDIKSTVNIVDVIGSAITLKRSGSGYMACCPFHKEKTPSFSVSESKGFYHCFGCGAHGDLTDFVAKLFCISQYDAAVKLNADFGLHLINQKTVPLQQSVSSEVAYRNWLHSAEQILNEYLNMLCRWKRE